MRFLFVHQSFPAQYWRVIEWLRALGHDITYITTPSKNAMRAVRKVEYTFEAPGAADVHDGARDLDVALRRADVVAKVARDLASTGYRPDMILGHHGWGELLNLQDVWPDVPLLGYFEFYYHTSGYETGFDPEFVPPPDSEARIRARNAVNLLALTNPGLGQTPTRFQLGTYPPPLRHRIRLIEEGVDLDANAPDPAAHAQPLPLGTMSETEAFRNQLAGTAIAPEHKLVTFVSRALEPTRGFHIMMRALPRLLRRRDVHVVMVGREGAGYGPKLDGRSWKQHFLAEVGSTIDQSRVHFLDLVDTRSYQALLRRSDAHVYLTYPFVASWSLREALATGCAVIGSDTAPVREFITNGHNGILVPFFDVAGLANTILRVLEDRDLASGLQTSARHYAQVSLPLGRTIEAYRVTLEALVGQPIVRISSAAA
jgi:glycosyltransferase involved in cell wall biosynthesis